LQGRNHDLRNEWDHRASLYCRKDAFRVALTGFVDRTYGPDSVGVIRNRWVASLRDAYVVE